MRIGSLCSGFGGLDMAVMDVLDADVAWHAQYDPDDRHQYAAQILAHHWPDVPNHGDITVIDWAAVEPVDILTAGFPCQPVSAAGKKLGDQDDRWLWPDVAAAVRALRPRLVFLENVSAILVRGFGAVADSLAALGYDFAWTCLRASDVGGHTAASDGSALLGTPMTTSGCGPGDLSSRRNQTRLETQVVLLPTPRASVNENRQTKRTPSQEAGTHGKNLAAEVCELLPTPTTQAHSRNRTANRRDPKATTNTQGSTLLDIFWTGDPTDPPSPDGSTS